MASIKDTTASAATVRHLGRNRVTITPAPSYSVVLFNLEGGNVEAIVAAYDGSETIRLLIAGPGPDETMSIKTDDESGVVEIAYTKTETPN